MTIVAETSTLESTVRSLAGFVADRAPVTSCYLDVDGRRHPRKVDVERRVAQLVREGRSALNGRGDDPSVQADLHRIEEWVRAGFDRSRTRGLAFFSCTAHDLFEVVELPVPVRDRIVVNHVPAVGQLQSVLEDHEPIAVLLADRQRARVLVFELGEMAERSELLEELPRDYDAVGERDRGTTDSHVDALALTHLRHAADAAWRMYAERPFAHLAVGAPDHLASELEAMLHPYLRERLCGRIAVPVNASLSDVRAAALDLEHEADRRREAALVRRLRDAAGMGDRGVVGLRATLDALNERRVDVLLVSEGYREDGWRCAATGTLADVGPISRVSGERMDRVEDVVEEAIDLALSQGCRVEMCVGNADLDVVGRIGALLRY